MTTSTPDKQRSDTDAALALALRRCAAGDTRALTTIHGMTASRLRSQLLRVLPDRAEAKCVRSALRIWTTISTRGPRRPLNWMSAIARNQHRHAAFAPSTLRDDVHAEHLIDPAAAPRVESSLTSHAPRRGLGALSQEQQHCLRLAYSTGQSHEEIARGLGYPLGSVKSWIRRGLLSLRVHMQAPQA